MCVCVFVRLRVRAYLLTLGALGQVRLALSDAYASTSDDVLATIVADKKARSVESGQDYSKGKPAL
eukprot:3788680-Pyramimonas_sp.AAC.1